jgi:hypothetical protein
MHIGVPTVYIEIAVAVFITTAVIFFAILWRQQDPL